MRLVCKWLQSTCKYWPVEPYLCILYLLTSNDSCTECQLDISVCNNANTAHTQTNPELPELPGGIVESSIGLAWSATCHHSENAVTTLTCRLYLANRSLILLMLLRAVKMEKEQQCACARSLLVENRLNVQIWGRNLSAVQCSHAPYCNMHAIRMLLSAPDFCKAWLFSFHHNVDARHRGNLSHDYYL